MDSPHLSAFPALAFAACTAIVAALSLRYRWTAPAAIVATAPFAWYHEVGPTEWSLSKAAFVGAVVGVGLALWADSSLRLRFAERLGHHRDAYLLAGFAALCLASIAWAHSPADAFRDALKWVWYAGAFVLSATCVETREDAWKVVGAMFATASVVGAVGLWQYDTATAPSSFWASNGAVIGRLAATLEGPNQFGAYLETVIPPLLAILLFARLPWPALAAGTVMLGGLGGELFLAYSRGAFWSCVAGSGFIVAAYAWQRRAVAWSAVKRAAVVALPSAVVFLMLTGIAEGIVRGDGPAATVVAGIQRLFVSGGLDPKSDSVQERMRLWRCASTLAIAHPLAGVGAGNLPDAIQECGAGAAGPDHSNANNWYLETAADLGVAGVALLGAFLFSQFGAIRRQAVRTDPVALGSYAVLIAFALHGTVDDVMPYPKAALTFFILIGMMRRPAQGQ